MIYEPEAPDWDEEGDCERCGEPLVEKPGRIFYGVDNRYSRPCFMKGQHRCNMRHGGSVERCDLRADDCRHLTSDQRAQRLGVLPDKTAMTASDVLRAIKHRHRTPLSRSPEWLLLYEVALGARRVDAMALRLWTSKGLHLIAYEVKVSRADLLGELRRPEKRQAAIGASTEFWFATPVGLMAPDEVPAECGLVEFGRGRGKAWRAYVQVQAPRRRLEGVPADVLHHVAWRLRDVERRLQGRGIVL